MYVTSNFVRMLHLHFSPARIRRVLQRLDGNPFIAPALDQVHRSNVFEVRAELETVRVRDDDWFFSQVNPALQ